MRAETARQEARKAARAADRAEAEAGRCEWKATADRLNRTNGCILMKSTEAALKGTSASVCCAFSC